MISAPLRPKALMGWPSRALGIALAVFVAWGSPALAAPPQAGDARSLVLAAPDQSAVPAATRALAAAIVQELLLMGEGPAWSPIGAVANSSGDLDAQLNKALADARASFDTMDLERAAARYEGALARLDKLAPQFADKLLASRALLMLGATQLLLGDEQRAEAHIARAAGIDPALAVDPTAFSPATQPVFTRVVQSVRASPGPPLRVATTPPGAVVYVNGRFVGTTPLETSEMPNAPALLQVAHEGFEPHSEIVLPTGSTTTTRDLTLVRSQALARELAAARAAVSKLDERGLPMPAQSIALARRSKRVYVLWSDGSSHRLVSTAPDGKDRGEQRASGPIDDPSRVVAIARALLGRAPVIASAAPTAGSASTAPDRPADEREAKPASLRRESPPIAGRGLFSHHAAKNRALWFLYTAAIATGGAASYFGVRALDAQTKFNRVAYENPAQYDHAATTDQIEGRELAERGNSAARTADVLAASAAALAVTAVALHVLWTPETAREAAPPLPNDRGAWSHVDVTLVPSSRGASVILGARF